MAKGGINPGWKAVQKKLKLISLENEDDLGEIADVLAVSPMPTAVTELGKEKKIKMANHTPLKKEEQPMQSQQPVEMRAGGDQEATVKPSPQIDNTERMEIPLEEAAESNSGGGAMAAEDHLLESKTTEHELASVENTTPKEYQKEPSEDTVPDCNEQEETGITQVKHNMAEATSDATGIPATTIPSHSSHHKLDDDDVVVTDGKEDDKEKEAEDKKDDKKATGKEAEHQRPQHAHGPGARPKEPLLTAAKTAGPSEAAKEKATEQADEAEHQSPQHAHGPGARPKEPLLTTAKTAGPSEAAKEKATEQADEVAETKPHGTLFAESSSENFGTHHLEAASSKEPTEGAYSGPSTPTGNISLDVGNESDELYYSDEKESTESLEVKPKSTMHVPGQGASASATASASASASKGPLGCHHPPGVFSTPSYQKASGYSGHAVSGDFSLPELIGAGSAMHVPGQGASASASKGPLGCHHPPGVFSSTPSYQKASGYGGHAAPGGWSLSELMGIASAMGLNVGSSSSEQPYDQTLLLQQLLSFQQSMSEAQGFNPSTNPVPQSYSSTSTSYSAPTADSPLQANCYRKAGYSVVITNGHLCESTSEKGVVIMESGTKFCITIANENDYAAEVDITFGGMFLGVWMVEAKRSFASPLVIEGSSWAAGRLTFFSHSDERKPQPSASFYGESPALNGLIELEFKPEAIKVYAQHIRQKDHQCEILVVNFKTATVGDLKQEIRRKWSSDISYLTMGGKVLQEETTISSCVLNQNEVIQVLNAKEELKIESVGRDPVVIMVDPRNVSVESVQDFIKKEIKIEVDEQLLRFKGQDIDVDSESLTQMLITSKQVPVLRVYKDTNINVKVVLPNRGSEAQKIEINWFATVDNLKEKLEERNICDTSATLKFNETGQEISGQGSKKLIDLGFKNKSEITVLQAKRSTHRGFSSSDFDRPRGSGTRGFGGGLRGFDDYVSPAATFRGSPSGIRTLRSGPEDVAHDSSGCFGEEGIAMLHGTEENVHKQFELDDFQQQFSKEKAVTLVIQLKAKSMGATGGAGAAAPPRPSVPSGAHYSGGPTGPMSTPTPPPVPE